ncbi:hypothetical protein Godav_020226 [Gossypium davidsonii]|uniref:Retrotransposon Copia-like N-terminal domain-containing protein n=1 Tax=Gossypium davidsonii TaxID=34287 RepID=A0A7J8R365_GOSDV|nr:hypothetical protein [Gossypium davidsonii]
MVQPGEISDSVSADSSCPATSDASSSTKINQTFNNKKLNVRLDEKSFLQWKQQVFLTVRNHGLEKFLTGEVTVPSANVRNSEGELVENEAYERYIQQDCALASWFLLLTLLRLFSTKPTTKICDTLAACGNSLSEIEHVATILNGLPVKYDPFIAVIAASREPVSLEGACYILVDVETRQLNSTSRVADLVVDHTHNTNFVAWWDILLTDASIAVPVFLDNILPSYGSSITMSADRSVLGPLVQSSTTRAIQLDPSVSAT